MLRWPASCLEFSVKPDVRVFPDANELSLRAAEAAAETINDAVRSMGTCSLVLSGGSTPRILYSLLASRYRDQIPWGHVHVFWGDERCGISRTAMHTATIGWGEHCSSITYRVQLRTCIRASC